MTRRADWEHRLAKYLAANRLRHFAYGEFDCALFVCGAITAMTDIDPAAWFRGRYRSRREARALMKVRAGTSRFADFFAAMAKEYEMPEITVELASCGDIVLVKAASFCSLGLMGLNGRIILAGETAGGAKGLGYTCIENGLRAWRV